MEADRPMPSDSVICRPSADLEALLYDYAERHPDAFPAVFDSPEGRAGLV
jgi:hypothetical protein